MDIVPRYYRLLLACYPRRFRREAEAELLDWVRERWLAARGKGRVARLRLAITLVLDTIRSAPPEWWSARVTPPLQRRQATSMDTFLQDLRYALRSFRTAPIVTLVTALTIAIGIGATTTVFSVANALLLRAPAGVRDADRLVTLHSVSEDGSGFHSFSYPDFRDLQRAAGSRAGLAAYSEFPASLKTGDAPELRFGMLASANYFAVLGARPALGRFFLPEEDAGPGGPRVVVLSHAVWQRRFGGDSALVGRAVELNGQPFTVVGIAERGFHGHAAALEVSLWIPLALDPVVSNRQVLESRRSSWLEMVGRMDPATGRSSLASTLTAIRTGSEHSFFRVEVRRFAPLPGQMLMPVVGFLGMLLVLAGLILLIASANVGNVLLARASARTKEIAVRLAVGAGRARLVRQLVTESLLLFFAGGVAGTLLAVWATTGLASLRPPMPIPLELDFHVDVRVLVVTLGITLLTGMVFGLAPALQSTRPNLTRALRDEPGAERMGKFRIRGAFVAAQIAGTVLLLVTAGLFSRALGRAGTIDLGFDPAPVHVLNLQMQVKHSTPEEVLAFAERLVERAAALPGVEAVSVTDFLPLNMGNKQTVVALEGREQRMNVGIFETDLASVSPDYFRTLAMPILRGRPFTAGDRRGAPAVAVINEELARQLWPDEEAVGKALRFGSSDGSVLEIVGVARNAKYRSIGDERIPMLYLPLAQQGGETFALLLRTRPGAASPAAGLRAIMRELDSALPIASNTPYLAIIGLSLIPNRIALSLALLFGVTGLILASVGLYGVLSYMVSRRRREIGIRMALGAPARAVGRLVLRDGMRMATIGLAAGLVISLLVSRLLRGFLFGLSPLDPLTYAVITVVLGATAFAACAMPVRRALRTEPLEVLRHD